MVAYYFGYGSNLNPQRMTLRGVEFTERRLAKLTNFKFALNIMAGTSTAANIVPKDDERVYGALYTCTDKCLDKLDVFELVDIGMYKRTKVKVELHDGSCQDAIAYIGQASFINDSLRTVEREYLNHILCGRDILPAEYTLFLESFLSWCPC